MIFMKQPYVKTNKKKIKRFIQFFQISAIFDKFLKILPQNSFKPPQRPECKQGSFCSIFYKLSENHNLQNSPGGGGGGGFLAPKGPHFLFV